MDIILVKLKWNLGNLRRSKKVQLSKPYYEDEDLPAGITVAFLNTGKHMMLTLESEIRKEYPDYDDILIRQITTGNWHVNKEDGSKKIQTFSQVKCIKYDIAVIKKRLKQMDNDIQRIKQSQKTIAKAIQCIADAKIATSSCDPSAILKGEIKRLIKKQTAYEEDQKQFSQSLNVSSPSVYHFVVLNDSPFVVYAPPDVVTQTALSHFELFQFENYGPIL